MIQVASYSEKEPGRFRRGQGWKVNLFGQNSDVPTREPQAYRIDMNANMVLDTHLHVVDQFQVFIAGSGRIGRDDAGVVTVHYADHHTAYGPLVAGPQGMSYLTLRSLTDAGMVKLSNPDLRSRLAPSQRRYRMSQPLVLSIPPVLQHRDEVSVDCVFEAKPGDEGLTALVYRLGSGMQAQMPETAGAGGYYVVVLNGAIEVNGTCLPPCSVLFVRQGEEAPLLQAAPEGAELLVTVFPVPDQWMQQVGLP